MDMLELRNKIEDSIDETVDEMQCLGARDISAGIVHDVKEVFSHKGDKLFITEILNDLHRNGFVEGGKAETMLHDWASELREKSRHEFPASRLKIVHSKCIGKENW